MTPTLQRNLFNAMDGIGIGMRRPVELGFSLIELMVTVTIAAVLVAVAVPSFTSFIMRTRLKSVSGDFISDANVARSEAIKRNTPVSLCATDNAAGTCSGSWENGWVVGYTDNTATPAVWTVVSRRAALPDGYLMQGGGVVNVVFQPSGHGSTSATLSLCQSTPSVSTEKKRIEVSATGRARVVTVQSNTSCP